MQNKKPLGYCGNSPAVIHRHYKQLCTPADAQKFFSVKPAQPAHVLSASVATPTNELCRA